MQCFNGQETVMDSLQNGLWKFWTGQQISDYCAINVWHAYKYLNIGQCRYTIDFWLVCLPQQFLTFDTAITILILYSQEILNPLWTNLQQIQDTYTTYTSPQFASSSTTVARNRKQNMWSSSVKENGNGTWSVNIRVSVLKTPNLWAEGSSIIF